MSRLLTDERTVLLARGVVVLVLAISLLNLTFEIDTNTSLAALSGALAFVYVSVVLAIGVFRGRPFASSIRIALFSGLTVYWAYDYLGHDNTLSGLFVVLGLAVVARGGYRLLA